jgi:hypothetical protein
MRRVCDVLAFHSRLPLSCSMAGKGYRGHAISYALSRGRAPPLGDGWGGSLLFDLAVQVPNMSVSGPRRGRGGWRAVTGDPAPKER